jgi:MFS family permease
MPRSLYKLFENRRAIKSSVAMLILCSVQNFGYYGLMIWLPTYLSKTFGYSANKSSLWLIATIMGMCFGIFVFGQMADRIGRRRSFFIFQASAAIMVLVYSQLTSPIELLIGGAILGIFVNGMIGGYGALISELFPTSARATAQNFLFNFGRGAGGFGPLVMSTVAVHVSFAAAIAFLSTIYVIDIIATALLIPETKGSLLE